MNVPTLNIKWEDFLLWTPINLKFFNNNIGEPDAPISVLQ